MVVSLTVNSTGNKRKHLDCPMPSVVQIQTRVTLAQLRFALLWSLRKILQLPALDLDDGQRGDLYPGCHFEPRTVKPPRGRQPTRPPAPLDSPVFTLVNLLPSPFPFTAPSFWAAALQLKLWNPELVWFFFRYNLRYRVRKSQIAFTTLWVAYGERKYSWKFHDRAYSKPDS